MQPVRQGTAGRRCSTSLCSGVTRGARCAAKLTLVFGASKSWQATRRFGAGVTRLTCALTPCRGSRSGEGAGAWRSQVAHSLGVRVVGPSNRLAPTLLPGGTRAHARGCGRRPPPAFAVSLLGRGDFRFEVAARFARRLAAWVLERGLPPDTLLNVNVPAPLDGEPIRGFALTRMGRRRYGDAIIEKVDPRGKKYYWIGGDELAFEDAEGTDFHAVSHGLISVTPIHLDLTNYKSFDALRALQFPWP